MRDLSPVFRKEGCGEQRRSEWPCFCHFSNSFSLKFSVRQVPYFGVECPKLHYIHAINKASSIFALSASYIPATKADIWNTKMNKWWHHMQSNLSVWQTAIWNSTQYRETSMILRLSENILSSLGNVPPFICSWIPNIYIQACSHSLCF